MGSWSNLQQELLEGQGFAVSDGSYRLGSGAAAWILEGTTSHNCIRGECFVPGYDNDHSSFCSELLGLYSLLLFLHHAGRHSLNHKPTFKLACDGKSVLHWLWQPAPTSPTEPHYDLLSGTRYLLSHCGYHVTLSHVYGHQDTGAPMVLRQEAQLNIEADARAKEKLACYVSGPLSYTIPFAFGSCYLGTTWVVKNIIGHL